MLTTGGKATLRLVGAPRSRLEVILCSETMAGSLAPRTEPSLSQRLASRTLTQPSQAAMG